MNIDVQQTPNPDTLKFVLGFELVQNGTIEFKSHLEAKEYPFVQKIFKLGAELIDCIDVDSGSVTDNDINGCGGGDDGNV